MFVMSGFSGLEQCQGQERVPGTATGLSRDVIDFAPGRWHRRRGVGEDDGMQANSVPAALVERLGPDATNGLLRVFELERRTWSDEVLNIGAERFERRLAETASGLRVQIAESEARLRQELSGMEVRIVREIAASRVDLFKWSFVFWIGQVVAVSAVMAAMLRVAR
ncbi:MAG TPA: hypothetical protein VFT24_00510 [Vicinamibacterales bacterium]|nr:hypothetical protein [Vicinamibacterales bacterium]